MTFSDLVLQLFAFVLVAAVLGTGSVGVSKPDESIAPRAPLAIPAWEPLAIEVPDALSLARFDEMPRFDDLPHPATVPVTAIAIPAPAPAVAVEIPPTESEKPTPTLPVTSLAAELESFVVEQGLGEAIQVAVNGGGVTLSISDTIGFASGSADLLPEAAPVLAEVRSLVGVRPDLVVEVAGHTDDRPVYPGVFQSNLDLSLARAARVARELAAGDPALTARIFAAGYGAQRPVASNTDIDGRARNRRVELRLVPGRDVALEPPRVRPTRQPR